MAMKVEIEIFFAFTFFYLSLCFSFLLYTFTFYLLCYTLVSNYSIKKLKSIVRYKYKHMFEVFYLIISLISA